MGNTTQLEDRPDDMAIEEASRIWRDAEEVRAGASASQQYLDEQQSGFVEVVGRPDAWISVALEAEVVVGCVAGFPGTDPGQAPAMVLAFLAVEPTRRRAGLGRRLVSRAEERALSAGFCRLILTVHEDNAPARGLYARCGWEPTGRTERTPVGNELLLEYERQVSA